ncbi:MAG TPA: hypothetical protein VMF29_04905, partial [Candidatus Edwardsbacteria bacterium]|nr:hypothetical protein [Candidatus Edwardsbacteria bacterium]
MDIQQSLMQKRSDWRESFLHPELFIVVLVIIAELLIHQRSGVIGYAIFYYSAFSLGAIRFILFP